MIRVVLFLLMVALVAAGFAWLADRPGDVVLTWMGYRIETSLTVAALAVVLLALLMMLLWSIARAIRRSPEQVSFFFRHRRAMKGYLAVSRGLIAIGSGDMRHARRFADDAKRLSPDDPLTLLLVAQSAQMAGDRAGAERAFREMVRRDETKLLGLRGLYIEAQRRNDLLVARRVAEEAAKVAPALTWAGQALVSDRCAASDWTGALTALENMKGALDKAVYRRERAVLLTARALALEETDREASASAVLEAVKLAPDLVPAAALAGRQMAGKGERRRARRILEAAWLITPHPDLAEVYANLQFGDSARERLVRMQRLAATTPGQREGALAVARAAVDAREFAVAREALAPYLAAPTRRVAGLMAEIEETEHGDHGRAREWMNRAMQASGDPMWTADGVVSDRWMPVSPSGRLDGFEWRVPLAEIGQPRPVMDLPTRIETEERGASASSGSQPKASESPKLETFAAIPSDRTAAAPADAANIDKRPTPKPVEPVIPVLHAPDDPGPDANPEGDSEGLGGPEGEPWQRLRQGLR